MKRLIANLNKFIFILLIMSSCQLETVIEKDTEGSKLLTPILPEPPIPNDSVGSQKPKVVFHDYSVNNSQISWDQSDQVLTLVSLGGTNLKGGFQGSGQGNKPLAGIAGYHRTSLRDFKVDFEYVGETFPWMNLLIDTDGDDIANFIFVPIFNKTGNFLSWDPLADSFKVVCMPTCGTWSLNSYDFADFPQSRIVDSVIVDGGMPADSVDRKIKGVLFSAGSGSTEVNSFSVKVKKLNIP